MDSQKRYIARKIIGNNAVLAVDDTEQEVILLGKSIGYGRKKNDIIRHDETIERVFVPSSDNSKEAMLLLFAETEEEVIRTIQEYIRYVEKALDHPLSEEFAFSFIDHLSFAIKRLRQGIRIYNPFLHEVKSLYPAEYAIAGAIIPLVKQQLGLEIPEDELGFITLHLRSAQTNQTITAMNRFSKLIALLVELIEKELAIRIDKTSTDYARLVTHLRFAIDRAEKGQGLGENHPLSSLLQKEYPVCYNLSYKLVKIMQNELKLQMPEAEVSYLTLHIQRLESHFK
jgi:transcriptional antiterminator